MKKNGKARDLDQDLPCTDVKGGCCGQLACSSRQLADKLADDYQLSTGGNTVPSGNTRPVGSELDRGT